MLSIRRITLASICLWIMLGCGFITPTSTPVPFPTVPTSTPFSAITSTPFTPTVTSEPGIGAAGIGDTYFPDLGNGGYDAQHYTLALDVKPETNELNGTVTIEATTLEKLETFNLDSHALTIDSINVDDQPATFSQNGDELTITPSTPLESNKAFVVVIDYHASPELYISEAAPFAMGWSHTPDGSINVFGEPAASASWFPNNDHPRDKATYRFEITVPDSWMVAATGVLQDTKTNGNNTTFIWEMDQPMASYLASISIDHFELVTQTGPNGIRIRNYFPVDTDAVQQVNFESLSKMIDFFDNLFGPYPFDEYGVVVAASDGLCGEDDLSLEAQSLSIHCPSTFMTSEIVIAHELAHQWFGDSVSLKNWQDIWLKEGFATYASWLWSAKNDPRLMILIAQQQKANMNDSDNPVAAPSPQDIYTNESYVGGATVLQALRMEVGDDTFFNILRTYADRYKYGVAGTDDFIAVAEEVSGKDLTNFFNEWLFSPYLPDLPSQ